MPEPGRRLHGAAEIDAGVKIWDLGMKSRHKIRV